MTILLHDAREHISSKGTKFEDDLNIHELLYADDTLLIEADAKIVEEYMHSIEIPGMQYGLAFNFGKIEALPINCEPIIKDSQGNDVKMKDAIIYLGALLSADGKPNSELSRRIGAAQADFKSLTKVWNHTNIGKKEKVNLSSILNVSKLMYALARYGSTQ